MKRKLKERPLDDRALIQALQQKLLACHPMYRQLRRLVEVGLSEEDISRVTGLAANKLRRRLDAMRRLRLLPESGHV